jgi:DNA-binding protein HU-beta
MTKAEVIAEIASLIEKEGGKKIEKEDVSIVVEAFFNVVKENMANGENIYVRGFGSFINKKRAKKKGRDISKNTIIEIEEHYIPSFKPAKIFLEQVKFSQVLKEKNLKE